MEKYLIRNLDDLLDLAKDINRKLQEVIENNALYMS